MFDYSLITFLRLIELNRSLFLNFSVGGDRVWPFQCKDFYFILSCGSTIFNIINWFGKYGVGKTAETFGHET